MAWWYDRFAIETTLKIRDQFNITTYIETGTFKGLNILFHSYNFRDVYGIEVNQVYSKASSERVKDRGNVIVLNMSSDKFLKQYTDLCRKTNRQDILFIYLDAHFYNPGARTKEERWIVINELKSLVGFNNCVIAIHDFDCNGLGHLIYDGEHLNFDLIKNYLHKINPDFHFYCNNKELCRPHTEKTIINIEGIETDKDTLETIQYHEMRKLQYRGILYCLPDELDLSQVKVVPFAL